MDERNKTEFITIADAAERYHITESGLRLWVKEGRIKAYTRNKVKRPMFLRVSELEDAMRMVPRDPDAED